MNQPKFLPKLAMAGVTSITAIAGSMLVAPSASASTLIFPDQTCFVGTVGELLAAGSVTCEDKLFNNFEFDIAQDLGQNDVVDIGIAAGEFFFEYAPSTTPTPRATDGEISYDVAILPEFVEQGVTFDTLEVDSAVVGIGEFQLTKEFVTNNGIDDEIFSINGGIDSASILGATFLSITDIYNSNGDELETSDNAFTQKAVGVPEPGTVLGLLAVSGLGLGLKRKKQS